MSLIAYEKRGRVAVITMSSPPVNGLGHALRVAIAGAIDRAYASIDVEAIVITGAGTSFSAGADIREIGSPKALAAPNLAAIMATIEEGPKPVIAAIHGHCLGGGLEFALGCHYRVAKPDARISLPEVRLGILPGAGGTQRLPRVVDLETAIYLITSGDTVQAASLHGTGMFDEIVEGELVAGAIAFAEQVLDEKRGLSRARDRHVFHPNAAGVLQSARTLARVTSGPYPAPLRCLDAIEAAVEKPFDEGLAFEREVLLDLVSTPESKALRHVFLGERAAGKIPGAPASLALRPIVRAAVIGVGAIGVDIAANFTNAGIQVTFVEFDGAVLDHSALASVDIVIEAVCADLEMTRQLFQKLDAVLRPGAIIATTNSTLDIDRIAEATSRPGDVVGMHFGVPASVKRLIEIVRGASTSLEVLATTMKLAKTLQKIAVVSGASKGHIGERMLEAMKRQALWLFEQGVPPKQIDSAMEQFGFAIGAIRMSDLADANVGRLARRAFSDIEIVDRLVLALVNEGAKILEEGVAWRASDIDMVSLNAHGFPPHRGGPMLYADTLGLDEVVRRVKRFATDSDGDLETWRPAKLLAKLARLGRTFN